MKENHPMDIVYLAITFGFFGICLAYAAFFEGM